MGIVENVNNAANFMKVAPGKIGYNSEKIITRYISKTNESISGYSSILQSLARDSKNLVARESLKDIETELQVAQWIDYSVLFVSPAARDKHVAKVLLDELNEYLGTRSYLVNHTLTLADIVVFYSIQDTMVDQFHELNSYSPLFYIPPDLHSDRNHHFVRVIISYSLFRTFCPFNIERVTDRTKCKNNSNGIQNGILST
ncbi:eukaryotic translation elongation factor 1 epsilon-1 isoform X1 [Toxorhynchites rutilus septentrionalis]|uniref:eukaryotic translation elongation factor 1 epsilon-1 isoform X1 n=1 Tax=Toxorhynchites rutilus septentrionalis TaxID=329112 RepID=UPI00247AAD8B|nr:eukaryotic translation elongation factor 1 epsilon-1 isoform X1 [Toxorhynchites rutilus septentrionalis]